MYSLFQKIQIGNIGVTGCVSTEITKSIDNFTQNAVIVLPNILYREKSKASFIVNESENLEALISRDDVVKIWSGYNKTFDQLPLRFTGFVTRMEIKENITIYCEDYGYALKSINVASKTFYKTPPSGGVKSLLKNIVNYVISGTSIQVNYQESGLENLNVGDFIIDNNSVINGIQVFQELEKVGLKIFPNNGVLYIGVMDNLQGETKSFIIQHNVAENNLIYKDNNDDYLVLKGISNLDTNEKIELFAYTKNKELIVNDTGISGEQRTLNAYNKTESELEALLRKEYPKFYYTGYSGTFTTYLEPLTEINDYINLYDLQYQERNGKYKVRSVVTKIDMNGGFQEIELRQQVSQYKAK